jgi:regulator of RNase E activity RraB
MADIESIIEGHHARNRELLKSIATKGADPDVPREIDLHFWAWSEDSARKLSTALGARGYSPISMNRAVADPSLWNVETRVQASPVSVAAPAFIEDLARLADANDGEFDGWGTSI